MAGGQSFRSPEENPPILLARRIAPQRLIRRRRQRFTGPQAEPRAVPRTDDLAGFDFGALEGLAVVGAAVFDGIESIAAAHDDDREAVELD